MKLADLHRFAVQRPRLLLDTVPLTVLMVGMIDPRLIGQANRTQTYDQGHFTALAHLWKVYSEFSAQVLTTAHVLTETSNFLGHLGGRHKREGRAKLAHFVANAKERQVRARDLIESRPYFELGITDTAIHEAADKRTLVVTGDGPLAGHLATTGAEVILLRSFHMT